MVKNELPPKQFNTRCTLTSISSSLCLRQLEELIWSIGSTFILISKEPDFTPITIVPVGIRRQLENVRQTY